MTNLRLAVTSGLDCKFLFQKFQSGLQPYHSERARSRLISEAKQGRAWLVLGWEKFQSGGECVNLEIKCKWSSRNLSLLTLPSGDS